MPTAAELAMVATPATQDLIWKCVALFLKRYPFEDPDDAHGVAMDEAISGAIDHVPEAGLSFHSYLQRRIMWALSRQRWVRWKRRTQLAERSHELWDEHAVVDGSGIAYDAELRRMRKPLREAIEALPFDYQFLIRRVYLEGASVASVGREMGKSTSAASRMHHTALTLLKAELTKRGASWPF